MTDEELRKLAEAATPGPYSTAGEWSCPRAIVKAGTEQIADCFDNTHWTDEQCARNAAFIAAANPTTVLSLLDRLAQAEMRADHAEQAAALFLEQRRDAESHTAEAIAAWLDAEADAMLVAAKHAPTERERVSCAKTAEVLREAAADIRAGAWREVKP